VRVALTHLICDCDGVLVDSEAVAFDALCGELHGRLALPGLHALIRERLGLTVDRLLDEVAALAGVKLDPSEAARIAGCVEQQVLRAQEPMPGVAEALARVALPKAVASNSSTPRVQSALQRAGVAPLFGDRIYTAERVGAAKPHPGVYLAAAAGFGVASAQCVVVEDSVAGVSAATAAGMTVLGFAGGRHVALGHGERLRAAGATTIFNEMRNLPSLIAGLACEPGSGNHSDAAVQPHIGDIHG
jgi:HAD superfamily hydrolase (TIGR01509 family)